MVAQVDLTSTLEKKPRVLVTFSEGVLSSDTGGLKPSTVLLFGPSAAFNSALTERVCVCFVPEAAFFKPECRGDLYAVM